MKRFIYLIIFILAPVLTQSQILGYDWSSQFGGPANNAIVDIEVDKNGNIYSTGNFNDSLDFDPGIGIDFKHSNGGLDIFITKQDPFGNYLWSITLGSSNGDYGLTLDTDTSGYLYLSGGFMGTVDFDPGPMVFNLTSSTSLNTFILKLDSNGNFIWAKQLTAKIRKLKFDVISDAFYIADIIYDTTDFDPGSGVFNLYPTGSQSTYIAKMDTSGNLIWAKNFNGIQQNYFGDYDLDSHGNIYIRGNFNWTVDFDPGSQIYNLTTTVGGSGVEGYVVKLTPQGDFIWAKQIIGNSITTNQGISVDPIGNSYIIGHMNSTIDADPGLNVFNLFSVNYVDIFVCKWDSSGNFNWAKQIFSKSIHFHTSNVDNYGNLYLGGDFLDSTDFDPGPNILLKTVANSAGDIYYTKWDSAGNFQWVYHPKGGSGNEHLLCAELISNKEIVVSGVLSGVAHLDAGTVSSTHTSAGGQDPYILKLAPCSFVSYNSINDTSCNDYLSPSGLHTWTTSGNYQDTLYNYCGGDSIITVNLIIPIIDTSISINGNTLTSNMSNSNYQWVDCSNNYTFITGETAQNFSPTSTGSYAVIITEDGCIDTSYCHQINNTFVDESENTFGISIYPNPNSGQFTIQKPLGLNHEIQLKLLDINSKLIFQKTIPISDQKLEINTNSVNSGVYYLQIIVGQEIFMKKLIMK